jgi:RNA polymerase sigma factor (TIGR02999 family)
MRSETALLRTLELGRLQEGQTLEELFTAFYDELRRRANWELRQGAPVTMGPTTLLHEAFVSMSPRQTMTFADQRQFVAYAARAMRGLIIDHLRSRGAQKRGGHLELGSLPSELPELRDEESSLELEKLRDALESLTTMDARLAECVELKFFCGLSFADIARLREVSERTVQRDWDKARLLLSELMKEGDAG